MRSVSSLPTLSRPGTSPSHGPARWPPDPLVVANGRAVLEKPSAPSPATRRRGKSTSGVKSAYSLEQLAEPMGWTPDLSPTSRTPLDVGSREPLTRPASSSELLALPERRCGGRGASVAPPPSAWAGAAPIHLNANSRRSRESRAEHSREVSSLRARIAQLQELVASKTDGHRREERAMRQRMRGLRHLVDSTRPELQFVHEENASLVRLQRFNPPQSPARHAS
jgi:hypothetical protein